jgi:hypothetical protein
MGAAKHRGMQHAGQDEIIGVGSAAGDKTRIFAPANP